MERYSAWALAQVRFACLVAAGAGKGSVKMVAGPCVERYSGWALAQVGTAAGRFMPSPSWGSVQATKGSPQLLHQRRCLLPDAVLLCRRRGGTPPAAALTRPCTGTPFRRRLKRATMWRTATACCKARDVTVRLD